MKTYPFRTFVHRILLIRLGIAATLIAVCAGFTTYLIQKKQLTQQVIDLGGKGIATLANRVRDIPSLISRCIHMRRSAKYSQTDTPLWPIMPDASSM